MSVLPTILKGALQAKGQLMEAKAMQKAHQFNARILELEAENIEKARRIEEYQLRRQREFLEKRQRGMYAKAGVAIAGSPFEVMLRSTKEAILDAMVVNYNAYIKRRQKLAQAEMERYYGKVRRQAGVFGAAVTLLSTAAEVYSQITPTPKGGAK